MEIKQLEMENAQLASRKPHAGMRLPPLEADQMQQDADLDDMDNATAPPVYDGQPDPHEQNQQPMPEEYPEEVHDAPTEEQVQPDDDQIPQQQEEEQPDMGETQQRDDPPSQLQGSPDA